MVLLMMEIIISFYIAWILLITGGTIAVWLVVLPFATLRGIWEIIKIISSKLVEKIIGGIKWFFYIRNNNFILYSDFFISRRFGDRDIYYCFTIYDSILYMGRIAYILGFYH